MSSKQAATKENTHSLESIVDLKSLPENTYSLELNDFTGECLLLQKIISYMCFGDERVADIYRCNEDGVFKQYASGLKFGNSDTLPSKDGCQFKLINITEDGKKQVVAQVDLRLSLGTKYALLRVNDSKKAIGAFYLNPGSAILEEIYVVREVKKPVSSASSQ